MSTWDTVSQVLLWLGVATEAVCCVGAWWAGDVFDRLHYAAAAGTAGAVLIAASAAVAGVGSTSGTVQVVSAAAAVMVLNPVLTHATARSARRLKETEGPDQRAKERS